MRGQRIAFDRRSIDVDGRMTVTGCLLTRACVSPYLGREIPDPDGSLGLDPDRTYMLYRDATALRDAVREGRFENQPLQSEHIASTADDPQKYYTVGAVSNAVWKGGAVYADLRVWDGDAVARIQDGSQRDLSVGYRYTPLMTLGTIDGESYDGIMGAPIIPNHIALVQQGRVDGALVGDRALRLGADAELAMDADAEIEMDVDVMTALIPGFDRLK
jgi:hypothetical protein